MSIKVFPIWRSRRGSVLELRTLSSLSLALESLDPFNNDVARFNWRNVRRFRGW